VTNTLAYYDRATITAVKSFIVQAPGAYPRLEHLEGCSIGQAPVLPTNIKLGWKGFGKLERLFLTNALANYKRL